MKIPDFISEGSMRRDIPQFRAGDTVEVLVRIIEGGKEKQQIFKGTVIAKRGGGIKETFVVRKIAFKEGVEKTFYLNSPVIKSVKVLKRGRVRRAKLYYMRGKIGKKARIKEAVSKEIRAVQDAEK